MWLTMIAILTLQILNANSIEPGPSFPPTKGEIWPKPQVENKEQKYFVFNPSKFNFTITDKTCLDLEAALSRYVYQINGLQVIVRKIQKHKQNFADSHHRNKMLPKAVDDNYMGIIKEVKLTLTQPCETYPYLDMDEAYNLTISSETEITSDSIWGIYRGLESLSQLFYLTDDYKEVRVNYTQIIDYPRHTHRGLLLDTSRHFITTKNIYLTLDAMAINKMNVFHWHIVDDQSFPYQSEKYPELSEKGAYHPIMVYTKEDIQSVVEYARLRGIRVIPEFDVPGHTRSWGVSHPQLLTKCYSGDQVEGLGPMNPLNNNTYALLKNLFQEVQQWFPDKYFHIGGDEVDLGCWMSNPEIIEYMEKNDIQSIFKIHALFMENAIPLLSNDSNPIVWQEVFDENVPLSKNTIVQVWKGLATEMTRILRGGHKVLFSTSWYLDHLASGGDWKDFYDADPREMIGNATLAEGIVGGEACMWGEVVDDRNVLSRVWPRTSAVAERLWSAPGGSKKTVDVLKRLEEHTCRMIRRKIPAQPPNGPGFCVADV